MATIAQQVLRGDSEAVQQLASGLLKPLRDNFVERPWGGGWIRDFKRIGAGHDRAAAAGGRPGEAFEIAADESDEEARLHPSRLRFEDGSELTLPEVLARHAERLLGADFIRRYGARFPLLPKTLDIGELLSVQGHPPGNAEAYVIIAAEPGATIRLGFSRDMDAGRTITELTDGRRRQQALLELLAPDVEAAALQAVLGPWLADRRLPVDAAEAELGALLADRQRPADSAALLDELKRLYWQVLDSMNAIPVSPGQVIHNATPPRLLAPGALPSAEVHALGNPERREILCLEVRRPGPTFRAWDNVRFPIRDVDVPAAVTALNLRHTDPSEFIADVRPVDGRAATFVSVDSPLFRVEHLRPGPGSSAAVDAAGPHSLHLLAGAVRVETIAGARLAELERGESAIVPVGVGAYRVSAADQRTELVKVSLPAEGW